MGIFNFLKSGSDPYKKAEPHLNKIEPMARQNLSPWMNQGQEAQQGNQGLFKEITQDPAAFVNKLMSNYTPSRGFQYKQEEAMKAARAAARSSGVAGTPADVSHQTDIIQKILSQGEGQYFDQIMQALGLGAQGQENIANRGFGAAGQLTNTLGETYGNQGQLAFEGQKAKNDERAKQNQFIMQTLAALAGGAIGGPAGAGGAGALFGGAGGGSSYQPSGWGSSNPADFLGYGQKNYYNQFGRGM
jgi:hypothetical protein